MPLPVIERAMALVPGVDFVNAYGLTETSSSIAVLSPDEHREGGYHRTTSRRPSSGVISSCSLATRSRWARAPD